MYRDTHAEMQELALDSAAHFVFKSLKKSFWTDTQELFGGVESGRISSSVQP